MVSDLATSSAGGGFGLMAPIIIVLLVVGAAMLFVVYTRARIDRRNDARGSAREQIARVKSRVSVEEDFGTQMGEMVELSRRLAAQLDTKAARLEQLLDRAETVIERLAKAQVSFDPARALGPKLEQQSFGEVPREAAPRLEYASQSEVAMASEGACSTQAEPPLAVAGEDSRVAVLTSEIIRLAEEGSSPVEIAQQLEEATGKVELILALHRQAQRCEARAAAHA